jgi:hypothetical protein
MEISLGNSMLGGGRAEGRLAAAPSLALDSLCRALLALPDFPQPLPQPEAVIAGLQIVREAARRQGPPSDGFWTFTLEPVGGSGGQLTLRRDAAALEIGFQVDGEGSLDGMFRMSFNGQEHGFSLEQAPSGWVLRKWQGERQVEFPLPAGAAVPCNAAPRAGSLGGPPAAGGEERLASFSAAPAPETQWHYLRGGVTEGPVAESTLRTLLQTLPPDTLVWNPGLPDWKSAKEVGLAIPPAPPAPPPPPPAAPPPSASVTAPAPAPTGWELVALTGHAAGHSYAIAARTRVGSGENCDVRLPDPAAAPVHALLMERPDGFWIADNRTEGGTFVNNARVQGPTLLAAGDVIRIGGDALFFRRAD